MIPINNSKPDKDEYSIKKVNPLKPLFNEEQALIYLKLRQQGYEAKGARKYIRKQYQMADQRIASIGSLVTQTIKHKSQKSDSKNGLQLGQKISEVNDMKYKSLEQFRQENKDQDQIQALKTYNVQLKKIENLLRERVQIIKNYYQNENQQFKFDWQATPEDLVIQLKNNTRQIKDMGSYYNKYVKYHGIKFIEVLNLIEEDFKAESKIVSERKSLQSFKMQKNSVSSGNLRQNPLLSPRIGQKIRVQNQNSQEKSQSQTLFFKKKNPQKLSLKESLTTQMGSFDFYFPEFERKNFKSKIRSQDERPSSSESPNEIIFTSQKQQRYLSQCNIISSLLKESECGCGRNSYLENRDFLPAEEIIKELHQYDPKIDLIKKFNQSQYLFKDKAFLDNLSDTHQQKQTQNLQKSISYDYPRFASLPNSLSKESQSQRNTFKKLSKCTSTVSSQSIAEDRIKQKFNSKLNQLVKFVVNERNGKNLQSRKVKISDDQLKQNCLLFEESIQKELNRIKRRANTKSKEISSKIYTIPTKTLYTEETTTNENQKQRNNSFSTLFTNLNTQQSKQTKKNTENTVIIKN